MSRRGREALIKNRENITEVIKKYYCVECIHKWKNLTGEKKCYQLILQRGKAHKKRKVKCRCVHFKTRNKNCNLSRWLNAKKYYCSLVEVGNVIWD